jgi:hypothetical protein
VIGAFDFLMMRSARGKELEAAIDGAIRHAAAWKNPGPITLAAKGWPSDVIENVLAGYREKGWSAEVVLDPRDGDFIQLTARVS